MGANVDVSIKFVGGGVERWSFSDFLELQSFSETGAESPPPSFPYCCVNTSSWWQHGGGGCKRSSKKNRFQHYWTAGDEQQSQSNNDNMSEWKWLKWMTTNLSRAETHPDWNWIKIGKTLKKNKKKKTRGVRSTISLDLNLFSNESGSNRMLPATVLPRCHSCCRNLSLSGGVWFCFCITGTAVSYMRCSEIMTHSTW